MRFLRRPQAVLPSRQAYAQWATSYPPHAHNPLMEAEQAAMLSLCPELDGQVVVDLACGSGRYARIAVEQGARLVLGVDDSPQMLRAGLSAGVALQAVVGSMTAVPLRANIADTLFCGLAIGHTLQLMDVLGEVSRLLRGGGVALLSDFHPDLYANGARRTFHAADGRVYMVEHHVHAVATVSACASACGLKIQQIRTPTLIVNGERQAVVVVYYCELAG